MNIREVLEIAVTMESDGIDFYTKAAGVFSDKAVKNILLELAEWEKKHYAQFSKLRDEIIEQSEPIVSPDGQAMLYLKAFVTGAIFDVNASPLDYIKPDSTVEQVFKVAIGLEKDAICCYCGIRLVLCDAAAKDKIDQIIKEEMEHVRILSEQMKITCK